MIASASWRRPIQERLDKLLERPTVAAATFVVAGPRVHYFQAGTWPIPAVAACLIAMARRCPGVPVRACGGDWDAVAVQIPGNRWHCTSALCQDDGGRRRARDRHEWRRKTAQIQRHLERIGYLAPAHRHALDSAKNHPCTIHPHLPPP